MAGQLKFDRPAMLNVGSYWRATVLRHMSVIYSPPEDGAAERTSCLRIEWSLELRLRVSWVPSSLVMALKETMMFLVQVVAMYLTSRHPEECST